MGYDTGPGNRNVMIGTENAVNKADCGMEWMQMEMERDREKKSERPQGRQSSAARECDSKGK